MHRLQPAWDKLVVELTALLDTCAPLIKAADLAQLRHFVDHNEFGLASEGLHAIMTEDGADFSVEQREELRKIGDQMGLELK